MNPKTLESFSYLFDDIESDMKEVIALDATVDRFRARQRDINMRIQSRDAKSEELQRTIRSDDDRLEALEQEIASVRRQRGGTLGGLATLTRQSVADRQLINQIERQIAKREEDLVVREAERRLRDLGKDLRAARGTRIPRLGGGYVTVINNEAYTTSQADTPSKRDLLREAEGQENLQPPDQLPDGSQTNTDPKQG